MNRRKLAVGIVLLLLLGAAAWALMPPRENPQVVKVRELQQKVFAGNPLDSNVPFAERRQAFEELRKEVEKLSPEERDKLMRDNPPPFVRRMQKDVSDYFELPPEKRQEVLDRNIDNFERMRRGFEQRVAQGGERPRGGFGPGGPGGRNADPSRRAAFAKRMLDNTTPDQRAQMSEYMRQMQDRRRQRGMTPMPSPRF